MRYLIPLTLLLLIFTLSACSGSSSYGEGVDLDAPKVQIRDLFLRSELMGQKVTVEGRIVSQCSSNGCWFYLQDDTGQVFIDLSQHGFELPALPNRTAIATGTVARNQQAFLLIASGVEVK